MTKRKQPAKDDLADKELGQPGAVGGSNRDPVSSEEAGAREGEARERAMAFVGRRQDLIDRMVREKGWSEPKALRFVELGLKEHRGFGPLWDLAPFIPLSERRARSKRRRSVP